MIKRDSIKQHAYMRAERKQLLSYGSRQSKLSLKQIQTELVKSLISEHGEDFTKNYIEGKLTRAEKTKDNTLISYWKSLKFIFNCIATA